MILMISCAKAFPQQHRLSRTTTSLFSGAKDHRGAHWFQNLTFPKDAKGPQYLRHPLRKRQAAWRTRELLGPTDPQQTSTNTSTNSKPEYSVPSRCSAMGTIFTILGEHTSKNKITEHIFAEPIEKCLYPNCICIFLRNLSDRRF